MKIICHGYKHENWTGVAKCKCGVVLEVNRSDIYQQYKHDIAGKRTEAVCNCPECNNQITVLENAQLFGDLPKK